MQDQELLSRERLAGYDPERLRAGIAPIVGLGALGNNVAQNLALSGVGEMRLVDYDHIETSNLTRSPLFRRERLMRMGNKPRHKSREAAAEILRLSYASNPIVRSAIARSADLGYGIYEGAAALASAVDSIGGRVELSDAARRLGMVFIEAGFRGTSGSLTVFANRTPSDPCYRCSQPSTEALDEGFSCTLYARQIVSTGRAPATQTVAALFGAIVAEAVIAALHGEVPLANKLLSFDLRTGRSVLSTVTTDPNCPGVHDIWPEIEPVEVTSRESVAALFSKAVSDFREPVIELRRPFVVAAPCAHCGRTVQLRRLVAHLKSPPACKHCPQSPAKASFPPHVLTCVRGTDALSCLPLDRFGFRPRDVVEITDYATPGVRRIVRLSGRIEELLLMETREPKGEPHTTKAAENQADPAEEAEV